MEADWFWDDDGLVSVILMLITITVFSVLIMIHLILMMRSINDPAAAVVVLMF